MSDLGERLARLGLSQYLEAFVSEGFDTWDTVLDITESDLGSLNVKLGHRRKLQRAIAESRGQSAGRPLPIALGKAGSVDGSYRSDDSATETTKLRPGEASATGPAPSTKRKYRRHPKPDEHAPERPPSAYVIFSNQVRETLKGHDLSFTEIAKVVGERWQVLPVESREACERQANSAKEKYYAQLAEYKKTPEYEAYQKYLEEFKAKHAAPPKGKRSKLEAETSASTRSSSHDQTERASGRRVSLAQSDLHTGHSRTESSPPTGPTRLPPGPMHPSKPSSPAIHTRSGFNSPRMADHYSPLSASPRSATQHKDNPFEMTFSAISRDARGQSDASFQYTSSSYGHTPSYPPSSTPPSAAYGSHYQAPVELHSRRSRRDTHRLPSLTHEETTLSSESGQGGYAAVYTGQPLPIIDASKSMRVLPAPVPSGMVSGPSPLDRPPVPAPSKSPQQRTDYRPNSSLAALLRAGELARVADADADGEEMDTTGYF